MRLNRKNKVLLIGFLITLYVCYAFAFSKTVDYYVQYNSQKGLIANDLNDPKLLEALTKREQQIDQELSLYISESGTSFQNELLRELTQLCNKHDLKIQDFKEPHIYLEDNVRVSSYTFSLEGSFNGMLLVLNDIENNPALGFIKHITFMKKKNYKTNFDYLISDIILQKNESIKSGDVDNKQGL